MNSTKRGKIFYLLSSIAILYVASIITFSFINPQLATQFFSNIGLNNSFINSLLYAWDNVYTTIGINYPGVLKLFLLTTLFLSLYGWFILSKGKNIIEVFLLFVVYLIPRPGEYWGKIQDKISYTPLPFSVIRVVRKNKQTAVDEFVTETISDLFGRYRLNFVKDANYVYFIHVNVEGYGPLLKEISYKETGSISIYEDIFLEPLKQNVSVYKKFFNEVKTHMNINISNYLYLASLISLLIGIRSFFATEVIPVGNYIFFFQYIIAVTVNSWRIYKLRSTTFGKVILYKQNKVLPNIKVQLLKDGKIVEKKASDRSGVLSFNVSPGTYNLELLDNQYEIIDAESNTFKEVLISEKGFLRNNIVLKSIQGSSEVPNLSLMNPFK